MTNAVSGDALTEPVRPLEVLVERWRDYAKVSFDDSDWAKAAATARLICADELAALLQAAAPPAPTAEQEQQPICVACSGCGWCEGSPAFTCPVCKGTGHVH
jgi:hypothetical protein